MAKKILTLIDSAYRCTVEEQDEPAVWITEVMKGAGGDFTHVIPVHEEALRDLFPSRITKAGLRITELALADGEKSRVR